MDDGTKETNGEKSQKEKNAFCENSLDFNCHIQNKMKNKITGRGKRCFDICLCSFILLDLLLLLGIIVAAYHICSERKPNLSLDALCLPCKDLRTHPDEVIKDMLQTGEKNETCCMKDTKNYEAFMSYFVDHWSKEKLAKDDRQFIRYQCTDEGVFGASKPNIKLVGRSNIQTGENHNVLWDSRSALSILPDSEDIVYHETHGIIEIRKTGLYQLYSQITLNRNQKWYKKQHKAQTYRHVVILTGVGESKFKEILKSSNSYCSCNTDIQTVTSYLAGAFELAKGDMLAVKVRNTSEVVPVAHLNYFGAQML